MAVIRCASCNLPLTHEETSNGTCPWCQNQVAPASDTHAPTYSEPVWESTPVQAASKPWGLYLLAVAVLPVGGLLGYAIAEIWFSKLIMVGIILLAGAAIVFAANRKQQGMMQPEDVRRVNWFGLLSMIGGGSALVVTIVMARGTVHADNASLHSVRLFLNNKEWMTLQSGRQVTKALTRGTYTLTVYAQDGNQKLDEHMIEVNGCGDYVLNVLGAQKYYQGAVSYGFAGSPPSVTEIKRKWFMVDVDHLFQEPPTTVTVSRRRGSPAPSVTRSFLTRGNPPAFQSASQPAWMQPVAPVSMPWQRDMERAEKARKDLEDLQNAINPKPGFQFGNR